MMKYEMSPPQYFGQNVGEVATFPTFWRKYPPQYFLLKA
jgi:hypothetical protein